MVDISVKEEFEKYLLEKNIVNSQDGYSFFYCKGGVSGTVAFVRAGGKEIIVKQALAQLKTKETWLCDPNRMNVEQQSNIIYHNIVPENAPEVYFYDEENYIYGREAVPESCTMWKADLLSGCYDYAVAYKAIDSLAKVHQACAYNDSIKEAFGDKTIFYDLRISPYIEFTVGKYPSLREYANDVNKELMESQITLIHGDYSPKNILVDGHDICILDYEVAHYGHPSFDLAFFSNHFFLKMIKNKQWAPTTANMLDLMLDRYFSQITYIDTEALKVSFTKLFALLFLARVDGKSPAEYISEDSDKELIRKIALRIIDEEIFDYKKIINMVLETIGGLDK